MKKLLSLAVFLILLGGCTRERFDETFDEKIDVKEAMNPEQIDAAIYSYIENEQEVYDWKYANLHLLWSAVKHGNDLVSIGFGENKDDNEKALSKNSSQIESDLLILIAKLEEINAENIVVNKSEYCNNFTVKIKNANTLLKLRNHKNVRYVEPIDYRMGGHEVKVAERSALDNIFFGLTCGDGVGVIQSDYFADANNNLIPWNWSHHKIVQAQEMGIGRGKNITISLIDTGLSDEQSAFKSPEWRECYSNGRSLAAPQFVNLRNSGDRDNCGHGTAMSAIATAPQSCKGRIPGVAFRSNLKVYRVADHVIIAGSDIINAVARAFELSSNDPKGITSLSMGSLFSAGPVADAIRLSKNRERLIFCAAGTTTRMTSIFPVIFPAKMAEVIAVTGIFPKRQDNSIKRCTVCHDGSEVDFAVVMEKEQNGSSRYVPSVGYTTGTRSLTGGSSAATATMAGIAALVWSEKTSASRTEVLNDLIEASQYKTNRNSKFGHGIVDAKKAVELILN